MLRQVNYVKTYNLTTLVCELRKEIGGFREQAERGSVFDSNKLSV